MNYSLSRCGGVVLFGAKCKLTSTVVVPSGVGLRGGGGGDGEAYRDAFSTGPQSKITGPETGPAFLLSGVHQVSRRKLKRVREETWRPSGKLKIVLLLSPFTDHPRRHSSLTATMLGPRVFGQVYFDSLAIIGVHTGVYVTDAALVRFTNCAIHATTQMPFGPDAVDLTAEGCNGCNVVLGSNNTALVIENSFWVWAEDCSFFFYPAYSGMPQTTTPVPDRGTRASIR